MNLAIHYPRRLEEIRRDEVAYRRAFSSGQIIRHGNHLDLPQFVKKNIY